MPTLEVWRGASLIGPGEVVAILTTDTSNRKLGYACQLWILVAGVDPVKAARMGLTVAACGTCSLRHGAGGGCYVILGHAPARIWQSLEAGNVPKLTPQEAEPFLRGRFLRLGAYGDPAALPAAVVRQLVAPVDGWTGYTSSWRTRPAFKRWCMASVRSEEERAEAKARGWRTYRIRGTEEDTARGELDCPARGPDWRITCNVCRACRGGRGVDVSIRAHGPLRGMKRTPLTVRRST